VNLGEAIQQALSELETKKSKATARAYRAGLAHLALYLAEQDISPASPVKALKVQHLVDFFPYLNAQEDLAQGSRRVYVAGVKYFVDWLVLRGILRPSYSDALRFEKAAKDATAKRGKHFPRTPSLGAAEKIMAVLDQLELESPQRERDIALCRFLYSSGCRADEVTRLLVSDLDLDEQSARVRGKGDKDRRVFFSDQTATALRSYFTERNAWAGKNISGANHPVFCRHDPGAGKKAKKISTFTVRKIVAGAAQMAGLDENFTPHSFRHAFAIALLRKTRDLALVQRLLGHEDPGTTAIYAEIYPDELREGYREAWEE